MKIGAVVLAAGKGSRFTDTFKLTEEIDGKAIVRCAVENAATAGLDPLIVVTGHRREEVLNCLQGLIFTEANNPVWESGQSSSFVAGIRQLNPDIDSIAAILGDMPLVKPETLRLLAIAQQEHPRSIIVPTCQGQRGNPAFFPQCLFAEIISSAGGDTGGRFLIKKYGAVEVETADPGILKDVDTREDYNSLTNRKKYEN